MYHVLMPIDADDSRVRSQIDAVLDLQRAGGELRVDVLHVYEEIDVAPDEAGAGTIDRINENLGDLQGLPDTADRAADALREAGIETAIHDVVGDPAPAIADVAAEYDVDSIVVGAKRRSPVGKAVFGSVAQAVILEADRPVLVAGP